MLPAGTTAPGNHNENLRALIRNSTLSEVGVLG